MGLCLYGKKLKRNGFVWCAIRRTNGRVAYSVRKSDPWWMRVKLIPLYVKPTPDCHMTTFIWCGPGKYTEAFG